MADNAFLIWFRRIMWAGIAGNVVVAVASLAATPTVLNLLQLPPASPLVWPRFAAWLLLLLSLLYVPSALDPARYRITAWSAVFARAAGVAFFAVIGGGYIVFGLFDFTFGLPQGILLYFGLRAGMAGAAP